MPVAWAGGAARLKFSVAAKGKRAVGPLQPARGAVLGFVLAFAGCGPSPVGTPVTWWHNLEGGVIAERRPPPPGAGLPYPKMYTVPKKPVLPDAGYRAGLEAQLAAERDRARQIAARNPVVVTAVPKPPPPVSPPPTGAGADTSQTANATIPAAEAPPAPVPAAVPGPAGPVVMAGAPAASEGLPDIPGSPPAPATFEGVPAEPLPTPPPPVRPLAALPGFAVLFPPGASELPDSQNAALKDVVEGRGKKIIDVVGHGDEQSDSPEGQEAALSLGLARARAVAAALEKLHVPEGSIRVSAASIGRGATVRYE